MEIMAVRSVLVILIGSFLAACMLIVLRLMPAANSNFAVLFFYAAMGSVACGPSPSADWTISGCSGPVCSAGCSSPRCRTAGTSPGWR